MNKQSFLKIWEAAALISLSIALCIGAWAQGRHESLSEDVLRLHVLAVSDSEYEQQLKLRVRDSVLSYMQPLIDDAENAEKAERILRENLQGIADAAYAAAEGRQVTVSIGQQSYPSRTYEGGTLPAGKYRALKVELGEAKGQNWWCVVFPGLSGSTEQAEELKIVSDCENRVFRFKILELWGELIN